MTTVMNMKEVFIYFLKIWTVNAFCIKAIGIHSLVQIIYWYGECVSITTCLLAINKWMSNIFFKLNEDKTEILLVGPKTKREMLFNNLGKLTPLIKSQVTSLGVILDSDLSFKSHINKVTKT